MADPTDTDLARTGAPTATPTVAPSATTPTPFDVGLAIGLSLIALVAVYGGSTDVGGRQPLSVALLLLESLPLVVRRRYPVGVLAVTAAATIAHAWSAPSGSSINEGFGVLVAVYTVAERRDRRTSVPLAVLVGAAFALLIIGRGGIPTGLQGLFQTQLVVGLAWAFGDLARTRRLYAAVLEDRTRLVEAEREERAHRAVAAERERIARELHDIVTHHVSVIVIQAGAAMSAIDRRPAQARAAIEAIDRTGRAALGDMRRMLGILGSGGLDDGSATPGREPQPDLDRLGELLAQVRAAGLPVELVVDGAPRPIGSGESLTAYRIVQEALTNTLKHARGARSTVVLRYAPTTLEIDVSDVGGHGARDLGDPSHAGRGIIGMEERVAIYGGTVETGATASGFRVVARLPIDAPPDRSAGTDIDRPTHASAADAAADTGTT